MIHRIKQNDRRPAIRCTLLAANGSVVNLTGATVRFLMGLSGSTALVNQPATVVDAVNGVVEYAWLPGDTANAGRFQAEFQVTHSDGRAETFPNESYIVVQIDADLGS